MLDMLYHLSGMIRDFPEGEQVFLENDGFSVLVRAMQGNIEKLKIKSAFQLRHMITTNSSHIGKRSWCYGVTYNAVR